VAATIGVILGAALTTLVISINQSVSSAARSASGRDIVKADLAVQARSAGGVSYAFGRRIRRAAGRAPVSGVVQVNSRLSDAGGGDQGVLSVLGVERNAEAFIPPGVARDLAESRGSPNAPPLVVGEPWLERNDKAVGDRIRLQTARGTLPWTIVGSISGDLPNNGAIAVGGLETIGLAFGRPDSLDTLYVQTPAGVERDALARRLRSAAGAAAVVGPPDVVSAASSRSLLVVQAMLLVAGFIGLLSAAVVVFVCWRLLLEDERANIARFRLTGATPAQLALGAGLVLLVATLLSCAIGLPAGIYGARLLHNLTSQLVGFTGLAAAFDSANVAMPMLAGLFGALAISCVAWIAGIRAFVAISALEAVRPPDPPPPARSVRRWAIGAGIVAIALAILSIELLPLELAALGVLLVLCGVVLVTMGAPILIGRGLAWRDFGFVPLAAGRHVAADSRRTVAITLMLGLGVIAGLTLGGVATSYQAAIDRSVRSWTHADLFVRMGRPGQTLRDSRFPPSVQQRLARLPGVAQAGAFTYVPIDYRSRNVVLQAYDTRHIEGIADLIVYSGPHGAALWKALDRGEIAISESMARLDSRRVGESLVLPSTEGDRRLRIAAVIDDYVSEGGTVVASMQTFRSLTGERRIDDVPLVLEPGVSAAEMAARVRAALPGYDSLSLLDRDSFRASITNFISNVVALFRGLALVAFFIILMAATLTLAASLSVRRRSLAIGQVCGAAPTQIQRQLCLEAAAMALVAWVVAAVATSLLIPSILRSMAAKTGLLPAMAAPVTELAVALPLGLAVALGASLSVSRMVLKEDIVDTLRFE
jgi:putative ABC transport system permease protein